MPTINKSRAIHMIEHTIGEVSADGSERVLERFEVLKAFNVASQWQFKDAAAAIGCHYPVEDTSLAGRHFRNRDGSRIVELR